MKQNNPKQQHWVPQFYLRYFATSDTRDAKYAKVWLWDKESQQCAPDPTSVKKICGQRYLYSPQDADGNRDWGVEHSLDRLETDAGDLWSTLTTAFPKLTDPQLRHTLASFVAIMHLRNVAVFRTIDSIIDLRTRLWGELSPEKLASRKPDQPDPTHSGRFFATLLQRDASRITEIISKMRWRVLCTDDDAFVTTDRPVVFLHGSRRAGPGVPGGFALFPISPRRILLADDQHLQPGEGYQTVPMSVAPSFNNSLREQCIRFLITGRPVNDVTAEIDAVNAEVKRRAESKADKNTAQEP